MGASHVKKFFSESSDTGVFYPPVTVKEIKQFKDADTKGYEQVSMACEKHYSKKK